MFYPNTNQNNYYQYKLTVKNIYNFIKLKNGAILTTGNYKIRDINKSQGWAISEDSAKTVNGLITEYLDFIPQASLCVEINKYRFEILEIEDNFISKVEIKREA